MSASSVALVWGMVMALAPAGFAQTLAHPVITPAATPTAAAPPQVVATVADTDANRYVIGADDSLQITVWQEPSISGTFPVRPDGMISLVLVGDIQASGLTPMHLAHDITVKLKKFIQDPIVAVTVVAVKSQRVYLVGQVGRAGPIELTPGMTPLQAIAEGGGLSPYTSGKHIYILRGPQGKQTKIPFNYKLALKGDNRQDVPLLSGDTIVVP
ncbi:MAG: polysaccharide biosynthesis/export family protein [Edaphobacter sp.]